MTKSRLTVAAAAVLLVVALLTIAYYFFAIQTFCTWQVRGQFGDTWGGLNALFSALALVGVVFALWFQWSELQQQRADIEESIREQRETKAALERQARALALNACAQVTSLELYAKHKGYGTGTLQNRIAELEKLATESLEALKMPSKPD